MKILTNRYFLWLMAGLLSFACSVQKRHYTRGYHLAWHKTTAIPKNAPSGKIDKSATGVNTPKHSTGETAVARTSPPIHVKPEETASHTPKDNNTEAAAVTTPKHPKPLLFKDWQSQKQQVLEKTGPDPKKSTGKSSPDETQAIVALVFSILGLTLLPFIGSIIGLVLANSALRKAKADPSRYGGEDLAQIARIVSIVGLVLSILFILFFLLIFVLILSAI